MAIIIDLGAHVGWFVATHQDDTVYAFEPLPANFDTLTRKFGHLPNIHLYQQAVGGTEGELPLYLSNEKADKELRRKLNPTPIPAEEHLKQYFPDARIPVEGYFTGRSSLYSDNSNVWNDKSIMVPTIKLSRFCLDNDLNHVDVLKIDVEGAEYDILEDLLDSKLINIFDTILLEDHGMLFLEDHAQRAKSVIARFSREFTGDTYLNTWDAD